MPRRGTLLHRLYSLAMRQHELLYGEIAEQGERLAKLEKAAAEKQEWRNRWRGVKEDLKKTSKPKA